MNISIIVATALNNAIGYKNKLLYWLPNDLKRFKFLTTGHSIIMGRKTFESLPKGALPNRRNIVLSTRKDISFEGAEIFPSLEEAITSCAGEDEIFIIGGASVYKQALNYANRIYLTRIEDIPKDADAFFPPIEETHWKEKSREVHPFDEKHPCSYSFIDYQKED